MRPISKADMPNAEQARLAIVVLNWRNASDTVRCLESLAEATTPVDVVVVDNDSGDGSADLIESSGLSTVVIRNERNDGYAGGNNVGLRFALAAGYEFIAVLNNDTLASPDTFDLLLQTCSASGSQIVVSPRIAYADQPDTPWFAGGIVDRGLPRHLQPDELGPVEGLVDSEVLSGCCLVASAGTWRSVGFFDEGYFLIFEDSDWSVRATSKGVRLAVDHRSALRHKVSRSLSGPKMSLMGTYFYVRNGLVFEQRYYRRHLPRFLWVSVLRPAISRDSRSAGRSRFAILGVLHWMSRRRGNAPAGVWRRAGVTQDSDREAVT